MSERTVTPMNIVEFPSDRVLSPEQVEPSEADTQIIDFAFYATTQVRATPDELTTVEYFIDDYRQAKYKEFTEAGKPLTEMRRQVVDANAFMYATQIVLGVAINPLALRSRRSSNR